MSKCVALGYSTPGSNLKFKMVISVQSLFPWTLTYS